MKQSRLPEGFTEERIQRMLAHYEQQADEEALAEDEAGVAPSETVMSVPHELVAQVRELIARKQS